MDKLNQELDDIIKKDVSSNINIDVCDELKKNLQYILLTRLQGILCKESVAHFARRMKEDPDNYLKIAGEALINDIIVDAIKAAIEQAEAEESRPDRL
jgi:hypothetical protein